jgi:predicted CoA-binding protein
MLKQKSLTAKFVSLGTLTHTMPQARQSLKESHPLAVVVAEDRPDRTAHLVQHGNGKGSNEIASVQHQFDLSVAQVPHSQGEAVEVIVTVREHPDPHD